MKHQLPIATIACCLISLATQQGHAQALASGMGLTVTPAKEQSKEQWQKDDAACYQWASQQTGLDPVAAAGQQVQQPPAQQQRGGQAAKGAAAGAVAGVVIGDNRESAARGAAIGALGGAIAHRRQAKSVEQNQQQVQQQDASSKTMFNNAFSACLQGRGYQVQ